MVKNIAVRPKTHIRHPSVPKLLSFVPATSEEKRYKAVILLVSYACVTLCVTSKVRDKLKVFVTNTKGTDVDVWA
jgi:hypothetical protein